MAEKPNQFEYPDQKIVDISIEKQVKKAFIEY